MSSINYDLSKIKAFIFDIDGVLSPSLVAMDESGNPVRSFNVKDRYAIKKAIKEGFTIAVISGANTIAVRSFLLSLGIKNENQYLGAINKMKNLTLFLESNQLELGSIAYIGDDIPDLEIVATVGLGVAPVDAAPEVIAKAMYISQKAGGQGVIREVIEQVLKAQGKWCEI